MTASTNRKKTPSRKLAVPDLGQIEQIPPELLRPYAVMQGDAAICSQERRTNDDAASTISVELL